MAELEILGDNLAVMRYDYTSTTISLLGEKILLNHYDELMGTTLTQSFASVVDNILDKEEMNKFFPSIDSIRKVALEHIKGVTNKVRFKHNLGILLNNKKISPQQYAALDDIIEKSTCPPVKLTERLFNLGWGDLISDLDFYEEDPRLTQSVTIFEQYLKLLKDN